MLVRGRLRGVLVGVERTLSLYNSVVFPALSYEWGETS
jgi:hypothetical protein